MGPPRRKAGMTIPACRGCGAWPALLALLALGARLAQARITDAAIVKDDRPIVRINEAFGFSQDGHIQLALRNFRYFKEGQAGGVVDFKRLGIFVYPLEAEGSLQLDLAKGACGLDVPGVTTLLTFDTVVSEQAGGANITSVSLALADRIAGFAGGEFATLFVNCQQLVMVSFDLRVSLYNVRANGDKDYLALGEDMLPTLYMVAFTAFAVAGALWAALCWRERAHAHRIHLLMGVLAGAKTLTLLSQAGMFLLIQRHGHPDGWNWAYYVFTFLRGLLLFTVIVLVGTGWSYMKPLLASREKRILMAVIPLQVCAEVAIVVLDEGTPAARSWFTWRDVLHIVDIVCCCAVLFPTVWSINHLRTASQTDGKAARNIARLQLFQQFYVMVVAYIYFTRILTYLLRSTLGFRAAWLAAAAEEAGTLLFYCLVGARFRPQAANPYLALAQQEEAEGQPLQP